MENIPYEKVKVALFTPKKTLFMTGLCLALLTGGTQNVAARLPQDHQITLNVQNVTVKEAIEAIKKQTDYSFFIDTKDVDLHKRVSVNLTNKSVREILDIILKNQHVRYEIEGKHIVISSTASGSGSNLSDTSDRLDKTISGVIKDSQGEPIAGANVLVKGITQGTITDADGRFSLTVPANAVLIVSYIGYKSKEISVGKQQVVNVALAEDAELLEEVVVTALGIKRSEKALGYSVQKVGGSTLAAVKTVDVATALTGKIAGLNVKNSTEFDTTPDLLLRGENPLLVIDGVPYGNMKLSDVASDDIQSVDILKGATASALYGARGASGAIMVTTKRGTEEGLNISINSNTMFNAGYLKFPEVQTSYSGGQGGKYNPTDFVWGDKLDIGRTAEQYDPYTYEWKEMPLVSKGKNNLKNFQEAGFVTNNNISITQKGKYGSFRTSLTHVYNKGQWPNTKLNKITYTASGNMHYKGFDLDAGITYNKRFSPNGEDSGYGGNGLIYNLLVWSGSEWDVRDYKNYWRVKDMEQNWYNEKYYNNPYYIANEIVGSSDFDKVNGFISGSYEVAPWLKATLRSGIDSYSTRKEWRNPVGAYGAWDKKGYYELQTPNGYSINTDFMLMADHKFGNFSLDGFVGGNIYFYQDNKHTSKTKNGLLIPGFYSLNSSVDPASTTSSIVKKQTNSVFAKASVAWKSTLFLDLTGRNDWSSSLPSDTRSYFYPSVAGSAVLSEFIPMPSFIDFWKIRGSWTMSKEDTGVYATNNTYSISTNIWDDVSTAYYPTTIRGKSVKPSTSKSYELGTMLTFFGKRLILDAAYYNKYYYNRIVNTTVSSASGFDKTQINSKEEYVRRGVEIQLSGDVIKNKSLTWNSTFNWALDRKYYARLDPDFSEKKPWVQVGDRTDYVTYADYEYDKEGKMIHQAGYPVQSDYSKRQGYSNPDWIWGWVNTFAYKNFTLSFTVDGRVGGLSYSNTNQALWNFGAHIESDNEWRYDEVVNGNKNYVGNGVKVESGTVKYDSDGNITFDDRVFAPNNIPVSYERYTREYHSNAYTGRPQNYFEQTFIKLRDLSLTYQMPRALCEKVRLKGATIGLVGQNLLIWTKEFKYSDPDIGKDNLNAPSTRLLGFNIKLDL